VAEGGTCNIRISEGAVSLTSHRVERLLIPRGAGSVLGVSGGWWRPWRRGAGAAVQVPPSRAPRVPGAVAAQISGQRVSVRLGRCVCLLHPRADQRVSHACAWCCRREETHCRFCSERLPDWRQSLTPQAAVEVRRSGLAPPATMTVAFLGQVGMAVGDNADHTPELQYRLSSECI
jgi:hypothetical protein